MTDNWNKYHESKDELIIALEKHLKNIDLVHVYDNKNNDGELIRDETTCSKPEN